MTTGETIAVKQVEMPRSFSDKEDQRIKGMISSLKAEIELLKDLDHPNIVLYLGAWARSGSALPEFRLICSHPPEQEWSKHPSSFRFSSSMFPVVRSVASSGRTAKLVFRLPSKGRQKLIPHAISSSRKTSFASSHSRYWTDSSTYTDSESCTGT